MLLYDLVEKLQTIVTFIEDENYNLFMGINSDDPLEVILVNSIETYSMSARLQRYSQDNVPINRKFLTTFVRSVNACLATFVEWYNGCISGAYTEDYKKSVKEAYENCSKAIINLNTYITDVVNKGESDIIWVQPDSGIDIPTITPLPQRA